MARPYYADEAVTLYHGDALAVLAALPDASVDALVTDPPAGIEFMGKAWDSFTERPANASGPQTAEWHDNGGKNPYARRATPRYTGKAGNRDLSAREGFIAAMTPIFAEALRVLKPGAHALVWAIPRTSHWTATALEDAGFEIRDVGVHLFGQGFPKSMNIGGGRGSALKPAAEHWILARKPLVGTIAANVEQHGTGALNIDACRIGFASDDDAAESKGKNRHGDFGSGPRGNHVYGADDRNRGNYDPTGRWPANVTLDEEAAVLLDEQSGESTSTASLLPIGRRPRGMGETGERRGDPAPNGPTYADTGGASRFFYVAKASPAERSAGLGARNPHPTVKPVSLMRWLARLITPPGGGVLDCFLGSGTTGVACALEGFRFIGVEREEQYIQTARARIARARDEAIPISSREKPAPKPRAVDGQGTLALGALERP